MTLKGEKILLKPINPVKLEKYVEGEGDIAELLELESAEDCLLGVDLSDFLRRVKEEPKRAFWLVPWVIIHKGDRRGLGLIWCCGLPTEYHEVEVSFPVGEDFFEEKCEAFELLCRWVAGHDKIYFLRVVLDPSREREIAFLQKLGFAETDEENLYECKSAPSAWLPILFCVGIAFGTGIGEMFGSMPLGSVLGMSVGFLLGSYFDKKDKNARVRNK